MVSVLVQRAVSEDPRWTRAVESVGSPSLKSKKQSSCGDGEKGSLWRALYGVPLCS